jgi:hypothetical protein
MEIGKYSFLEGETGVEKIIGFNKEPYGVKPYKPEEAKESG